jgi:hypothetical protein
MGAEDTPPTCFAVVVFFLLECRVRISRLAINLRNLRNRWLSPLFKPGRLIGEAVVCAGGIQSGLVSVAGARLILPESPRSKNIKEASDGTA